MQLVGASDVRGRELIFEKIHTLPRKVDSGAGKVAARPAHAMAPVLIGEFDLDLAVGDDWPMLAVLGYDTARNFLPNRSSGDWPGGGGSLQTFRRSKAATRTRDLAGKSEKGHTVR